MQGDIRIAHEEWREESHAIQAQPKPLLQLLTLPTGMESDYQDDPSDDFEDEEDEESSGQDEPSKDLEDEESSGQDEPSKDLEDEKLEQKEGDEVGQGEGMADPSLFSKNTPPEIPSDEGEIQAYYANLTSNFVFLFVESNVESESSEDEYLGHPRRLP